MLGKAASMGLYALKTANDLKPFDVPTQNALLNDGSLTANLYFKVSQIV